MCFVRSLQNIPRLRKYVRSVTFSNASISVIDKGGLVNLVVHQIEKMNFTCNVYAVRTRTHFQVWLILIGLLYYRNLIMILPPLNFLFRICQGSRFFNLAIISICVSNVWHLFVHANIFTYVNSTIEIEMFVVKFDLRRRLKYIFL